MFRINAFGQRVYTNPRLRFVDPPEGGNGGQGGSASGGQDPPADPPPADSDKGFPEGTPLEQMTVEQREAYWKDKARKHEGISKSRENYDQLKADSDELAQIKAANATEDEKKLEEARRDGENIGAQRYLVDAVKGRFQALTGKTDDEIDTAFAHVDATSFTNDSGDIDTEALKTFAATFGSKGGDGGGQHSDKIADALNNQSGPVTGNPGSIADMQKQARDRLTQKTNS